MSNDYVNQLFFEIAEQQYLDPDNDWRLKHGKNDENSDKELPVNLESDD
jgi:hypothetical protein